MSPSRAFRIATDQDQDLKVDSQEMGSKGWYALGWSFIASAGLTVSESSGDLEQKTALTLPDTQFLSFLFPVVFAIPVFDIVGTVVGISFAADWLFW